MSLGAQRNIVDHGFDVSAGVAYVAMPHLAARDLEQILSEFSPLDPSSVLALAIQLAQGLEEAHDKGIVHGDLKPSSVMMVEGSEGAIAARLAGFGLPAGIGRAMTLVAAGSPIGGPVYAAPELEGGRTCTNMRSDVWSLCAILYHALSGHRPFHEIKARQEGFDPIEHQTPPGVLEWAPWVSPAIACVIDQGLRTDPSQRPASARELLEALQSITPAPGPLTVGSLARVEVPAPSPRTPAARSGPPSRDLRQAMADVGLGSVLDGRYKLLELLGEGGMGAVYAADGPEGQRVAVKIIRPDVASHSSNAFKRFVREARAAMALRSENVARVLEAGTDTDLQLPFIVMELLKGMDLGRAVSRHGALDPDVGVWIVHQAGQALAEAHRLGLVHRDIKPANIFLHQLEDGTIVPKLCDFGIAKEVSSLKDHASTGLTQTGGMLGSPLYMSPEQAENAKRADSRSDVWSLAISLYETLTGQAPWPGCTSIGEVLMRLYTSDVQPIQELAPWIEPELAAVIHRGVRRDRAERHASASEFVTALLPFITRTTVTTSDLQPVSAERRTVVARRMSEDRAAPGTSARSSAASSAPDAPRRRSWVWMAPLLAVVAGGAFMLFRSGSTGSHTVHATSASMVSQIPSATPLFAVAVSIEPADAVVKVDGRPAIVDGGKLWLERAPGATVRVSLDYLGAQVERTVVVTADGKAMPDSIEVPGQGTANAEASGRVNASKGPAQTRDKPLPPQSKSSATPPAPKPDEAKTPKFNKEWE